MHFIKLHMWRQKDTPCGQNTHCSPMDFMDSLIADVIVIKCSDVTFMPVCQQNIYASLLSAGCLFLKDCLSYQGSNI